MIQRHVFYKITLSELLYLPSPLQPLAHSLTKQESHIQSESCPPYLALDRREGGTHRQNYDMHVFTSCRPCRPKPCSEKGVEFGEKGADVRAAKASDEMRFVVTLSVTLTLSSMLRMKLNEGLISRGSV